MQKLFSTLSLVAVLAVPAVMHADQISGQFSAGGSYANDTTADTLTFRSASLSSDAGTFYGDFISILHPGDAINSSLTTLNYASYNPTNAANTEVFTVDGLTIVLNSLQQMPASAGFFLLTGNVTFEAPGYTNTPGVLTFSSQGSGNVTFSATANATPSPVPEPSTLALLGTGGLGLAGAIRRRFAR